MLGADACLLVYDITNDKSFTQLDSWRTEFLHQAHPSTPEAFPFIVIGNKIDKETERRVTKDKVLHWCQSVTSAPLSHFETSAKESTQIESAFLEIARTALSQESQESPIFIPDTIQLSSRKTPVAGTSRLPAGGGGGFSSNNSSGCC
jgi:Ras-related protein Rab-7A